jgi:acid stress-induced BolA-like protein IbaG/YrbA
LPINHDGSIFFLDAWRCSIISVLRHQLIYKALGELMKQEIHALGIEAFTPTESN